MVMRYL